MKENKYEIGDRVTVYVWGDDRHATVTNISDDGIEVELDKPFNIDYVSKNEYTAYSDSTAYFKRFLIKSEYLIDKIKED